MTDDCPTCGAPVTPDRVFPGQGVLRGVYAVPALVRLAQHCEENLGRLEFYARRAGDYIAVANGHWKAYGRGRSIEAAASAALARLQEEAPNA